jgi:thiamine-phosphate pyrophosphorylase
MSLHLVIGQKDCLHYSIEDVIAAALKGGVTHVQLREKLASTSEFIAIGHRLKHLLKPYDVPLIINDRVDVAMAIKAEGIHLGQSDMSYPDARCLLGFNKIIGLTVETSEQMQKANQCDVQYVGVGPIFPTKTKLDTNEPLGISGLMNLSRKAKHPVIAIGGIHLANVEAVLNAGANGIAVVSAITHSEQPKQVTYSLKQIIMRRNL